MPIFNSPVTCLQHVPGYGDAGWFDPSVPGAMYLVWAGSGVLVSNNVAAVWRLNPSSKQSESAAGYGVRGLRKLPCSSPSVRKGEPAPDFATRFTPIKFRDTMIPTLVEEVLAPRYPSPARPPARASLLRFPPPMDLS